jgi:hypothetical protein
VTWLKEYEYLATWLGFILAFIALIVPLFNREADNNKRWVELHLLMPGSSDSKERPWVTWLGVGLASILILWQQATIFDSSASIMHRVFAGMATLALGYYLWTTIPND